MIGMKQNVKKIPIEKLTDLVTSEDVAQEIKEAAEISMGTEILKEDVEHIRSLAKSVFEISQYR